jgi:hypothetical protein
MSPIDRDKAERWAAKPGTLILLSPQERALIKESLAYYRAVYLLSRAEDEIADNLLRRIPDPKG